LAQLGRQAPTLAGAFSFVISLAGGHSTSVDGAQYLADANPKQPSLCQRVALALPFSLGAPQLGGVAMKVQRLSGLKAYRWQRFSAYGLMLYLPAALLYLYQQPTATYPQLIHTLSHPLFLIPSMAMAALLLIHSWVGLRDIFMDYLPKFFHESWLSPALTLWAGLLLLIAADLLYLAITLITGASS